MLLGAIFERAHELGLIEDRPQAAIDGTGLETRHVSSHYLERISQMKPRRRGKSRWTPWLKLSVVCLTESHLIAAVAVTRSPGGDPEILINAMHQAAEFVQIDRLLADKGYDAERCHAVCREELDVRSTVIPARRSHAGARKWPKTKYRRQMRRRFHKRLYRQRVQVESLFSRMKRRLGSALRSRLPEQQERECLFRVLTLNLMILAAV